MTGVRVIPAQAAVLKAIREGNGVACLRKPDGTGTQNGQPAESETGTPAGDVEDVTPGGDVENGNPGGDVVNGNPNGNPESGNAGGGPAEY